MDNETLQKDIEHLKLLSVFHYVAAAMTALFACFPIIHLAIGLLIVFSPETLEAEGDMPPELFGWFFVILASMFILMGWILAIFMFVTARSLARRKRYTFCLITAGLECILVPVGTILGVFTIVVLMRDSVKQAFAGNRQTSLTSSPSDS